MSHEKVNDSRKSTQKQITNLSHLDLQLEIEMALIQL